MLLKAAAVAFCLTLTAASSLTAAQKHSGAFTFTLHPHLTAAGDAAVDIRIFKSTYVAESASVACKDGRTTARVVYVAHGHRLTVVGQFVDVTKDGARFEIKEWNLPGR